MISMECESTSCITHTTGKDSETRLLGRNISLSNNINISNSVVDHKRLNWSLDEQGTNGTGITKGRVLLPCPEHLFIYTSEG